MLKPRERINQSRILNGSSKSTVVCPGAPDADPHRRVNPLRGQERQLCENSLVLTVDMTPSMQCGSHIVLLYCCWKDRNLLFGRKPLHPTIRGVRMGSFLRQLQELVSFRSHGLRLSEISAWERRNFAPPSPPHVKRSTLRRNGNPFSVWVETGTFQGDTTEFLARTAEFVHSIEPEPTLFKLVEKRFQTTRNVKIHFGLSENVLPELLPKLAGDVNFWLDGHYSGGITHRGPTETPILQELEAIEQHRERFSQVTVMIDDIRCFHPSIPEFASYPALDIVVNWARRNDFDWHIEHDIFIARG